MFSLIRHHPKALLWAIAVHVVFLVIMGVSFSFFDARLVSAPDSDVIRAVTVDPVEDRRKAAAKKRREKKRLEKIKQQRIKEKKRIEKEKRIALQKKKADLKRKADKKRKEQELKKQLELEVKQRQQQKLKEEQARREAELQKEIAEEQARLAKEKRQQQVTIIDKYRALIDRQIRQNWPVPAVAKPDMVCKIKVRLIPSGDVIDVRIISSSGNKVFDDSVVRAIRKASPLPLPPAEYGLFDEFREITFRVSQQNAR